MQKHPKLTLSRIEKFHKFELWDRLWCRQIPMSVSAFQPAGAMPAAEAVKQDFHTVEPGFAWGPIWSDCWFRLESTTPKEWEGLPLVMRLDAGAECIIWQDDEPLQGIDWSHGEYILTQSAKSGEKFTLYVRANGMNPNVSCDQKPAEPGATPFTFKHAYLAVLDEELLALFFDLLVGIDLLKSLPEDEPRRAQLLYAFNEIINIWDEEDRSTIKRVREIFADAYYKRNGESAHQVSAIGHAHIDTAWLWPLERTQQKCLHTFSTATHLMDLYPEYRFICSQAAQYAWVKELAPKLYERIRNKIEARQWEVAGSMWVEADCNITGGESLIRQILIAKNFWLDEFGIETIDLWLPDVFGYAAALPQILSKAGIKYFMTQKISWSQFNKFPHHTFLWQGIDGTKIFTHFLPSDTYNSAMKPAELIYSVHNFKDHDRANRSLYVFGWGDGGGGPTVEMLECARRMEDVEGIPKVKIEFARDFFQKAELDAKDLPVWVGELYLEYHRGTYTTQAHNKKGNRKSEFLLHDAEMLACVQPYGWKNYPSEELMRLWKLTLLNQFHDIIPGSSVEEVYRDSARDYADILQSADKLAGDSLAALGQQIPTEGMHQPVLAFQTTTCPSNPIVEIELPKSIQPSSVKFKDHVSSVQVIEKQGKRSAIFHAQSDQKQYGYAVYDLLSDVITTDFSLTVDHKTLDNGLLRVEFDDNGLISRVYDYEAKREVMNPGEKGNTLQLFNDHPLNNDAWDIDIFYKEKESIISKLDHVEVTEQGPVRIAIKQSRSTKKSIISQTIRLAAGSRRIEFVTEIDWHEEHRLLKAAFPVAINSAHATYEIQYGNTERPTHYNTSWDMARFEVAAQKWVDFSEGNYGVALMNDCKYGHDTYDHTLRLTLLRSPKAPDPTADMGHHTFTYALMPHPGDYRSGNVIQEAYGLNSPARTTLLPANQKGNYPQEQSFFSTSVPNVIIESVKKAEKEDALIVRLYEAWNARGSVDIFTSLPFQNAFLCDLMERDIAPLEIEDGCVKYDIKPFEIVTIKYRM
jgi:alpha-mannosidase